jgi:hypothetical protein
MRNVTFTLRDDTAEWLREFAAERGKSVSQIVAEELDRRIDRERIRMESRQESRALWRELRARQGRT